MRFSPGGSVAPPPGAVPAAQDPGLVAAAPGKTRAAAWVGGMKRSAKAARRGRYYAYGGALNAGPGRHRHRGGHLRELRAAKKRARRELKARWEDT